MSSKRSLENSLVFLQKTTNENKHLTKSLVFHENNLQETKGQMVSVARISHLYKFFNAR